MSRTNRRPSLDPRWILIAVALSIGIIGGCSSPQASHAEEPYRDFLTEHYQKLQDGRTVLCLYRKEHIGGHASGDSIALSCDWAGAIVHP